MVGSSRYRHRPEESGPTADPDIKNPGSPGDDIIHGSAGNDKLSGAAGNDIIYGSAGIDVIDGGPGTDNLYFQMGLGNGPGLTETSGDRRIELGVNTVTDTAGQIATTFKNEESVTFDVYGGLSSGHAVIDAGTSATAVQIAVSNQLGALDIVGSAYSDLINLQLTNGVIDGGAGQDLCYISVAGASRLSQDGEVLTLSTATAAATVVNVENFGVTLSDGASLDASAMKDAFECFAGGSGQIHLGASDDYVDIYNFGDFSGVLSITGGGGANTYLVQDPGIGKVETHLTDFSLEDTLSLYSSSGSLYSFIGTDHFDGKSLEVRYQFASGGTEIQVDSNGDKHADTTIYLDNGMFFIAGETGYELDLTARGQDLVGTAAGETLTGTNGDDFIVGLAGSDTLMGGFGSDVLEGNTGKNLLVGGHGADIFYFAEEKELDKIQDFSAIEGDKIRINARGATQFSDLAIGYDGRGGSFVSFHHGTIDIIGVRPSALTASDFLFGKLNGSAPESAGQTHELPITPHQAADLLPAHHLAIA